MLLLALVAPALASTLTVDPSDSTAYATIQGAVDDAASSGDIINVVAGTYTECLDFDGKDLTLTGAGSSTTTVDGDGACSFVLVAEGGETIAISGFTIENDEEQGLETLNSDITASDLIFSGLGSDSDSGGGAFLDGGGFVGTDVTFDGNTARYGGAIVATNGAVLTFTSSTFSANEATYGGAIYLMLAPGATRAWM